MKNMLFLLLIGASSVSVASTYTGKVNELRFSTGASSARVSISVGQPTACTNPSWYTFEDADIGLGKIWVSALLAAHATQRDVRIMGSGNCDTYGYESVLYIDVI